ncbi:hypothetical protein [Bradyrhizobium sp. USDA 10063]
MTRNSFRNEAGIPVAPAGSPLHAGIVPGFTPTVLFPTIGDPGDTLPDEAAERLQTSRRQHDEEAVLARVGFESWQEAREEVERRRIRLNQLRAPRGVAGGGNLTDDDPTVLAEQAALRKKEAELARLKGQEEQHAGRRNILASQVKAAEDWIKRTPAGMVIAMQPIEPQLKKGETIVAAIERLRRRGRELRSDLDRTRAAPWPSAIARAKMRQQIAAMAEAGRPLAHHLVDFGEPVMFPTRSMPVKIYNATAGAIGFAEGAPDVLSFVAWLCQDALIAALDREITESSDDPNALDAEQRRQAETEILADLLAVEREEAELVWRQAAEGGPIMHRPDIDPQALLGVQLIPAPSAGARPDGAR